MADLGWYIMHAGRRIERKTRQAAHNLAKRIADETRAPVTVRPIKAKRKAAKPATRRISAKANPDPGSFLAVWSQQNQHQAARLARNKATKARRLAKGLRGADRGGKVKAAERGAIKTAKFAVDFKGKINGIMQTATLYRASRSAAENLAGNMQAAGYTVKIREI
jgi:hypothetical protein